MTDRQIKILLFAVPIVLLAMLVFDRITPKTSEAKEIVNEDITPDTAFVPSGKEALVAQLSAVYTAEIGVAELTGKNDGVRVEEYLATCGLRKGYAWCGAFANWCFLQVGIKGGGAYSPNWFPADKTIYTRNGNNNLTPAKCDVLGLYDKEKGRIAHVGFIDEWTENGDYCITVEGNVSDKVDRKRRLKNQIYKVSRWI
jgi:hypothetical protein